MNNIGRYSGKHRHLKGWKPQAPTRARVILLLAYMAISFAFLFRSGEHEWKGIELFSIVSSWFMYIGGKLKVPDMMANSPAVILAYESLFYFLYLSGLCIITTFLVRVCKPSRICKLSSLFVPIAIHLAGVGFLLIEFGKNLALTLSQHAVCSLLALVLVLSYRIIDWRLAQQSVRQQA